MGSGEVVVPDDGVAGGPGWLDAFRRISLDWDPAMFIVTTVADGHRAGCLVGFAMQASIDPPRVLVGISRSNYTHEVAGRATALALHCPPVGARSLAELFGGESGDEVDKFARCRWREGPHGLPILEGCGTWLVGRIVTRMPMGDHTGMLCEIVDAREGDDGPQLRFRQVRHLDPGHAP